MSDVPKWARVEAAEFNETNRLCPHCGGVGYTIGTTVGYGGPDENGDPIPVPEPCQEQCQWCDEFAEGVAGLLLAAYERGWREGLEEVAKGFSAEPSATSGVDTLTIHRYGAFSDAANICRALAARGPGGGDG